jgi:hypothetical protein
VRPRGSRGCDDRRVDHIVGLRGAAHPCHDRSTVDWRGALKAILRRQEIRRRVTGGGTLPGREPCAGLWFWPGAQRCSRGPRQVGARPRAPSAAPRRAEDALGLAGRPPRTGSGARR